jgi:hypothetical protein
LPIPFAFLTLSAHSDRAAASKKAQDGKKGAGPGWVEAVRTIDVCFVSASRGNIVVQLHLEVRQNTQATSN